MQMLHWACADIPMRGNRVTCMTDNAEDTHTQLTLFTHSSHQVRESHVIEITSVIAVVTEAACSKERLVGCVLM